MLAAGRAALEREDELVFATASDEFARKKTKKKAKEASSSSSEEEDGASSALLQDLRKNWLGDATRKEKKHSVVEDSPRRRSKRFSFIEKGKKKAGKEEASGESVATQAMLQAALERGGHYRGYWHYRSPTASRTRRAPRSSAIEVLQATAVAL